MSGQPRVSPQPVPSAAGVGTGSGDEGVGASCVGGTGPPAPPGELQARPAPGTDAPLCPPHADSSVPKRHVGTKVIRGGQHLG